LEKNSKQRRFPAVAVDIVPLTLIDDKLQVALAKSRSGYLKGKLALIGGTVDPRLDNDLDETVNRLLAERGGLSDVFLEQLYTFGSGKRDERGWSVSVAYYGLIPASRLSQNTADLTFAPVDKLPDLPFDHAEIVNAAVSRVRGKGGYSTVPARLLDDQFSLAQMRKVYSAVLGEELDPAAFRRKVLSLGIIKSTNTKAHIKGGGARPSEMFELVPGIVNFDSRL
jgi:8-oxo-dGTP diphosphatase